MNTESSAPVDESDAAIAERILDVSRRIAPYVRRTPLIDSPGGARLKLESLQPTGSFKVRGFFAAALALDRTRVREGITTVSAGNAALACAYVARALGLACRVVMHESAPNLKVEGVRSLGGEIRLMPREQLNAWIGERGWEGEPGTFIHPFADPMVIAGHGSIALEVVDQWPEVRRIVVPVGGGGLVSGIALALGTTRPDITVVGVQSDGYALWSRAFAEGGRVSLQPHTIADGTTAPFDTRMFERLRRHVAEWIVVPESEVRASVARLASECRLVVEGAGALSYAALRERPAQPTAAVVSGGNIDVERLATLLTETRE